MKIIEINELDLTSVQHEEIKSLFQVCYGNYPSRYSFYHQPPHFRLLGIAEGRLVGQLSVAYRYISRDGDFLKTFGISEFCVSPEYRNRGYARMMLDLLIEKSKVKDVDVIVSLTDSVGFYERQGFKVVNCNVIWLMMKQNRSLGLINRAIRESLVVFTLSESSSMDKKWAKEYLDLVGTMF